MKKTHHGSCHCGAVRFRAELDLAENTSRCDCSICGKGRFWKSVVSEAGFQLLAGADALSEYAFGKGNIRHFFCGTCGIKTFGRGELPEMGKFVGVNIACLDDVTPEELSTAKVIFEDGKSDHWERPPAETRHL